MRLSSLVAVFMLASFTTVSWADESPDVFRADGFVESCKAMVNSFYGKDVYPTHFTGAAGVGIGTGYCSGYIQGMFWGSSMVAPRGGKPLFCKPDDVTVEQFAKVLIQDLDTHPDLGSEKANLFVTAMLMEHWPCKPSSP